MKYYIHKTSLKRGKSYIKSPQWLLNKEATINPKIIGDKCFQYAVTVALNHKAIGNHPEGISNIKPFIDQCSWKGINSSVGINDWKKFEQNDNSIAINILFTPQNKESINLAYKSKYNRKHENQVVLLMITNDEKNDENDKWHYIALKRVRTDDTFNQPTQSLSRLFREITSNSHGEVYFLNCLHSFRTDNAFKRHERI